MNKKNYIKLNTTNNHLSIGNIFKIIKDESVDKTNALQTELFCIIFDVDDTLIEWKDEYWNALEDVFQELNIEYSKDLIDKIISAIGCYEQENKYYNKQKMVEHINKVTGYNFNMNFLNTTLKVFGKCVPAENENIINSLHGSLKL